MDKYKEIKRMLKNKEVVQKYLGIAEKNTSTGSWYKSPFRREKTASFCVSDKGIHDFGDSTHYDIISFVQKYFNTTPYKALQILCNDFNITITENEYATNETLRLIKQKREEEKKIKQIIDEWFNREIIQVCDEMIINRKLIEIFEKKSDFEVLRILYDEQTKLEYYFETLYIADERTKEKLYLISQ